MDKIFGYIIELSRGLGTTLSLFALTIILSIPLGFVCSLGSLSKSKILRGIINVYVYIFRGTPLILQILFLFYGAGDLFKIPLLRGLGFSAPDRYLFALISLIINYAAYFSEIFRGGIQSVPKGQYEASQVLGLTKKMTNNKIILPQVVKIVFPSVGNEVINLVKDTALVSIIALKDIFVLTRSAVMRDANYTPFLVAAVFYLIINFIATLVLRIGENKLSYYR